MNDKESISNGAAKRIHARISGRAFDVFVGFIYAMTIALVIETAYLKSHFESVVPVTLTLLLLAFFAYDWLSRFSGRQAMSGKMDKARSTLLFRLILEIAIVYFLLLVCLKLVERYAPLSCGTVRDLFARPAGQTLSCAMAAFAAFSACWNALMIGTFSKVDWKHISSLLRGHLHKDIVHLFPFMKSWMDDLAQIRTSMYTQAIEAAQKAKDGKAHIAHMAKINRHLGWPLFLRQVVTKPHHLLLPYFFVFHVVALTFVLGGFLAAGALFMDGECLLAKLPQLRAVAMSLIPVGAVLAQVCFVCYFMSEKSKAWCERLGCVFLSLAILLSYSVSSAFVLMGLVISQQVGANIIMTHYFDPSKSKPKRAPGAPGADAHVRGT